ncbi:hypothetical protein CDL15_Pgr017328 [Punica granatum]|uniref:Uncharacterized protein n=1 Tax=Punica granatum TaxID=22663 RepID=A0A218Y2V9_PUNGR|nr:hypothetical protein CDL15_Pgr017328 [Punica granatum]
MGKEGRGYAKGISSEQEGTGRTRTSRRCAEQEEIVEAGSLGPSETRRISRLGRSRGLEEKGGMPKKKKKGRGKKKGVRLRTYGLGFGSTLTLPSSSGPNQGWASPESGLNLESQNRPDSAIPRFSPRFTYDSAFSDSPT